MLFLLGCCFLFILITPVALILLTSMFRKACVLCGLPKPSVAAAAGVLFLMRLSTTVSQAIMNIVVMESCQAVGVPRWEGHLIVTFLLLPIDLVISASLQAGLMNIRFGKGIEVWFVQMLMYLVLALLISLIAVIVYLAIN